MGYYTNFELDAQKFSDLLGEPTSDGLTETMGEHIEKNEEMSYALEVDGSTKNSTKWYDYEDDMVQMSKIFPDYLFTLSGKGEENGDIWKAYFKNGRTYLEKAKITFEDFDKELLREPQA